MRKRCGGVLSSSSLNVSQTQILEPHDERTDERAKKNIIRRKEEEWSEYCYEFVHGNSIVNNNNTDRGDDYILRGKVFQTLHVSSVLSAGGQVGFSELLGHRRLDF